MTQLAVVPTQPTEVARRKVKPVSLTGLTPAAVEDGLPTFEWVDPASLLVDEAYQRTLSERGVQLIRKIITGWDWRRFKPPIVARTDGGLEVIDGQHTATAAASHPGIGKIPVMVVDAADRERRARAFIGQNRDRLSMTAMQLHFAAVASGDDDALTVEQVCARAGVTVLKNMPANGRFKARETVAVAAINTLINKRTAAKARLVLQALANAGCAPISAAQIKAVDCLLHDPEFSGDIDGEGVTSAIIALGDEATREAGVFAATHKVPIWRALAITLFRKGRRRGRRRAD